MSVYKTECAQRGCESTVDTEDGPPVNCPVCGNPLLHGGVIHMEPPAPPPEQEPIFSGEILDNDATGDALTGSGDGNDHPTV